MNDNHKKSHSCVSNGISRYFAQMYTIHSYFPPRTYDKEHRNRVWVKRMIPCVWSFMKRRRPKDYVKLLEILLKEAQKSSCTLKPSQALIDFELAAKKAYDKVYIGIVVKDVCFTLGKVFLLRLAISLCAWDPSFKYESPKVVKLRHFRRDCFTN